jgi:hypothetical protein
MTVDDLEIPPNATIRQEYVKCGNPDYETTCSLLYVVTSRTSGTPAGRR